MMNYYILMQTKAHAFLLERKMKNAKIDCEISFVPRNLSRDVCNITVKFPEKEFRRAVNAIKRSGLTGCRLYKEIKDSVLITYEPVEIE